MHHDDEWFQMLRRVCSVKKKKFIMMDLNINSLISNLSNVEQLLNANLLDVLVLQKNWRIYPKQPYSLLKLWHDTPWSGKRRRWYLGLYDATFVASYKPPSSNSDAYLNHLDELIADFKLADPVFILGDLNIDLLSDAGKLLYDRLPTYGFENAILESTRDSTNSYKGVLKTRQSLLRHTIRDTSYNTVICHRLKHNIIRIWDSKEKWSYFNRHVKCKKTLWIRVKLVKAGILHETS